MSQPTLAAHPPGPLPVRYSLRAPLVVSVAVTALLAVTSVAGLLFGTRGLYTHNPATLPAFVGQDAITLLVVLPLLAWALWASQHGALRGLLLWMAALFYVAYSYAYYVLNPEFNVLYPAYLAVVALSLHAFLYLLAATDAAAVAARCTTSPVRAAGGFLMALSGALGLAWLAMIFSHLASGATPTRVNQVVWPMDLVVAFPAMFWGGLWLWRRQPLGYLAAGVLLVKGGLLGVTLVANTVIASVGWGVPTDPAVPVYALGGLGGLALAVRYLRSLDAPASSPAGPARREPGTAHRRLV